MTKPTLKIYRPDSEDCSARGLGSGESMYGSLILEGVIDPVRVSVGDIVRLLSDAALNRRAWVEDFADDAMVVSRDFYEVLLAYGKLVEKRAA